MTRITSTDNQRLKELKRLATRRERARSGRFAVEGEDLVLAAREAGREAVEGYRLADSGLGEEGFHDVEPAALKSVSTLGSGTRVIAVYEQRWSAPIGPLCVYLHGVGDPGNVGTIVRSAYAFGASCVALGPGCADPHSPKAVRASMGAIFALALARVHDVAELPGERIALSADAAEPLSAVVGAVADAGVVGGGAADAVGVARTAAAGADDAADRDGRAASLTLLVGAERDGLPAEVLAACERSARIAIVSESLNAAMAATVALYEVTRARGGVLASSRVRES